MTKKKQYRKPEITKVKLNPEEAVLTACKTGPQVSGPNTATACNQSVCVKTGRS